MSNTADWADFFDTELGAVPLVVILRGLEPDDAVAAARQAWDVGIRLVEVTIESERGLPTLDAVVRAAGENHAVGAGTVTTPARLTRAVELGARFAVSPGLDSDTVLAADEHGIPFLPGIATPSEAGQALRLGVTTVKAFPAATLGPGWVRALAGPFPQLRLVPTGGIRPSNATDYLQAGALAVGLGSAVAAGELANLVRGLPA